MTRLIFICIILFQCFSTIKAQEIDYSIINIDTIPSTIIEKAENTELPFPKENPLDAFNTKPIYFIDSLKSAQPNFILDSIFVEERVYSLGEDSIKVLIHWKSNNGLTYFNMHDDENICVQEGLKILNNTGGKLIEVKHFDKLVDSARYISFKKDNKIYTFDPNRIFSISDSIRAKTMIDRRRTYQSVQVLKSLPNAQIPSPSQCLEISKTIVKDFADTLIALIDTNATELLVALHNNKGFHDRCELSPTTKKWEIRNGSYSMNNYIRKGSIENQSCSDIYINPSHNLSGFFIVLKHSDFMHLVHDRCNAILQNENPIDDASLSVFAALHGIDYMNIEAKYNNTQEQILLLEKLEALWNKRQKNSN